MPVSSRTARLSGFILPCLPSPATKPPVRGSWLHENQNRWVSDVGVPRRRRRPAPVTACHERFAAVHAAVSKLRCTKLRGPPFIDGEVAALDSNGLPNFNLLLRRRLVLLY